MQISAFRMLEHGLDVKNMRNSKYSRDDFVC